MAAVVTPDGPIEIPADTPEDVARAISTASETRFCRFTGDLVSVFDNTEFAIEAIIGPERTAFQGSTPRRYKVRFLIPRRFPYRTAHTVPLDPNLKWYPHQNGDWSGLNHANVICPPRHSEIHLEELLLPHIRHTYRWITDALEGNLTPPDQRYELPHIIKRSGRRAKVYAEGGRRAHEWLRVAGCGRARLSRLTNSGFTDGLFRVMKLERGGGTGPRSLSSELRDGVFGTEEEAGWAPWVFVGDPVTEPPHRPPTMWDDLSERTQRRIMEAIRILARCNPRVPILLLAFAVPKLWGGTPDNILWQAIYLEGLVAGVFSAAREHSRKFDIRTLHLVREFIEHNRRLGWIPCTDISRAALVSRSGAGVQSDLSSTRIALLGVGAVGSVLATAFAKLDPARLLLVDKESIEPGNLVRHEALPFQVEQNKASSIGVLHPTPRVLTLGFNSDVVNDWAEVAGYLATATWW